MLPISGAKSKEAYCLSTNTILSWSDKKGLSFAFSNVGGAIKMIFELSATDGSSGYFKDCPFTDNFSWSENTSDS